MARMFLGDHPGSQRRENEVLALRTQRMKSSRLKPLATMRLTVKRFFKQQRLVLRNIGRLFREYRFTSALHTSARNVDRTLTGSMDRIFIP